MLRAEHGNALRYSKAMNADNDVIYQTIAGTLLAGRLLPGTQLVESRLAVVFGVSRERIRKILHRLGHERLLELKHNRGAFVANPSLEQARDIYEARRILEGGIVARLTGKLTATQMEALAGHTSREHLALKKGDRSQSIRLSGEFHVLLAHCAGNTYVTRQLEELVSRTSMLVAFFELPAMSSCACEEHDEIVQALRAGDALLALRAMHAHLSLIETRLTPNAVTTGAPMPDVEETLGRAWTEAKRLVKKKSR